MKYIARFKCIALLCGAILLFSNAAQSEEPAQTEGPTFHEELERIDNALRTNPSKVLPQALKSCLNQRSHAIVLLDIGMTIRAQRALSFCYDMLQISSTAPPKVAAVSKEELDARSEKEYRKALGLEPDFANGLQIYRECAACHEPEGWGRTTGSVPQIAGQHRTVVIRQLTDFRAGNRESILMAPYADPEVIGGAQAVADVAAYISTLEVSVDNGHGPGDNLELGEKLYKKNCRECHGESGGGSNDRQIPRLQAQHYKYLLRQFQWIRDGKRLNADPDMAAQIEGFDDAEMAAVLDYTSRLLPPAELRAPEGWKNPDFKQ